MYWKNVDPEEIPDELIDKHPSVHTPSKPEQLKENGKTILGPATIAFIFGVGVMIAQEQTSRFAQPGSDLELVGMLSLVGGFSSSCSGW